MRITVCRAEGGGRGCKSDALRVGARGRGERGNKGCIAESADQHPSMHIRSVIAPAN